MKQIHEVSNERVVLFDGGNLSHWHHPDGRPAAWAVDDGAMIVVPGAGNIVSDETFTDAFIHVEFSTPDMPEATGQAKGNSGVYLQGRYEIQVLDSYGFDVPGKGDCGAVYNQYAPLVNACRPPREWQTYEVVFRAPRFNDPQSPEPARLTVLQNGLVIHNNIELLGPTGGGLDEKIDQPGPLMLQDHGDRVRYRNIWLVHLPLKGSSSYEPS